MNIDSILLTFQAGTTHTTVKMDTSTGSTTTTTTTTTTTNAEKVSAGEARPYITHLYTYNYGNSGCKCKKKFEWFAKHCRFKL